MNEERQKIQDLSQSFASEIGKLQKIIASPDKTQNDMQSCMNAIYSIANNLHDRMDRMQSSLWQYQDSHADGHIPAIKGAGAMNKALTALGLDKDFVAQKKSIYASKDLFTIKSK